MNDLKFHGDELNDFFSPKILIQKGRSYTKAWLEIKRDHSIALANLRLKTPNANFFAVKTIRKAIRYEVNDVVLFLSLQLARYHTFTGYLKQVEKYQKIVSKYQKIVEAELKVESYLTEINKDIIKKVRSNNLLAKLNIMMNDISGLTIDIDSYSFILFSFELKLRKHQLEGNDEMIIETCREGLIAIQQKRFALPKVVPFMFTYPLIPVYLKRGEEDLARQAIEICYKNSKKKSNNWFVAHSYDVIMNLYQGNYEDVRILLNNINTFPTEMVKERYQLYKAYSALMEDRRFRVGKFINSIPEFTKDKHGYNVAIIIIQLLHLLKNKSHDGYIDRIHAINQYIKRAIKSRSVLRSKYFLRILLLLPNSNFHPVLFEAKSKDYLKKLKNLPMNSSSPGVEIELIPYEVLYNRVLELIR